MAEPRPRREPLVDTEGDWTITVFDDQPIEDGKELPVDFRVVVSNGHDQHNEFTYPAYRIYTLLAHWKEGIPTQDSRT